MKVIPFLSFVVLTVSVLEFVPQKQIPVAQPVKQVKQELAVTTEMKMPVGIIVDEFICRLEDYRDL